ncbi:hypothetical protein CEXT_430981 [Caerostris extrusa]|uniref:Uncharacterized protein n=1 Tax=Caerostris extrusa TaxID=172846 RepID=A0AAV4WZY3_CAEEX|nr:hypothetical protein CEXT_430981 [Caerostris extrusa]
MDFILSAGDVASTWSISFSVLGVDGQLCTYFQNFPYLLACGEKRWVRLQQQRLEVFHSRSLFFNDSGNDGIKYQFLWTFYEAYDTAFNVICTTKTPKICNLRILLHFLRIISIYHAANFHNKLIQFGVCHNFGCRLRIGIIISHNVKPPGAVSVGTGPNWWPDKQPIHGTNRSCPGGCMPEWIDFKLR